MDDPAPHSQHLSTNIIDYNGGISALGQECTAAPNGEQCQAEQHNWAMWNYLLNSIYTHKSCSYILEGVLPGFATESVVDSLDNPNVIMFSERNSTLLDDPNSALYYVPQDDYDTWPGECTLVRYSACGISGAESGQGWIKYDRHNGGAANYVYFDGHVKWLRWGQALASISTRIMPFDIRYPIRRNSNLLPAKTARRLVLRNTSLEKVLFFAEVHRLAHPRERV